MMHKLPSYGIFSFAALPRASGGVFLISRRGASHSSVCDALPCHMLAIKN